MKVIVKEQFRDKKCKSIVYSPNTIIEVEDVIRFRTMIENGFAEEYLGDEEPSAEMLLSDQTRQVRRRYLNSIDDDLIPIDGYDYPQFPFLSKRWLIEGHTPEIDQSIEGVSLFMNALSILTGQEFRLPTIEEWEFVARNGFDSLDKEAPFWEIHRIGINGPNKLGIYDMLDNGLELCSVNCRGNLVFVGKGGEINANIFEVTNYYSYPRIASRPITIRLVKSNEQPCNPGNSHPDIEKRILSALDASHDYYTDLREEWEH